MNALSRIARPLTALVLAATVSLGGGVAAAESPVVVTTVAGDPVGGGDATALSVPPFDVVEYDGDILIAAAQVVRRLDLETGQLSTFAGVGSNAPYAQDVGDGGPATHAHLTGPDKLAVGPDGSVYVAEGTANRVRRIRPDGTIETVAGRGGQAFSGDGGPATEATMYWPYGVAVDGEGTVYVSDHYNNRVRRITPDGTIDTIAGTGANAYSGDGGPAREAALQRPAGLTIDTDGSLLVADSGNHRIRRVRDGVITTVAGNGSPGNTGEDGFGDGSGDVGDGGPATEAFLHEPMGISVDVDGYLIADTLNHKIRRIDADGVITTVAGGGERHYGADGVPAVDTNLLAPEAAIRLHDGRLLIADTRASRVRVVDHDGLIHAVAGNYTFSFSGDGGPAARAQLAQPSSVTLDRQGDVYFLDHRDGYIIRRITASTGVIDTVMGLASTRDAPTDGSPARSAYLTSARAVAADRDGKLYVTDRHVIREVDLEDGTQRVYAGVWGVAGDLGDGGHRLQATFTHPTALLATADGSLYVADTGTTRVRRIAPDGTVHAFAGTGVSGFAGDGGPATAAQLTWPASLAEDAAGTVYVVDEGRIRAVTADGHIDTVVGAGHGLPDRPLPSPALEATISADGLAVLSDGSLVFTERFWGLLRYEPRTGLVARLAGTGDEGFRDGDAASARFSHPYGLAWDADNERLLVGDIGNARIRAVLGAMTPGPETEAPAPDPEPQPEPEPTPEPSPPVDACPSEQVPEDGFLDVPPENVHEFNIDCLVWWGVASGWSTTEYHPASGVIRAQMATFVANLVEAAGTPLPAATRDWFDDDDGTPHEDSINRLAEAGLVTGTAARTYGPGLTVRRDQMATFLVRTHDYLTGEDTHASTDRFTDDEGSTHEPSINAAAELGLAYGTGDGLYRPTLTVPRDQMASFLARVLHVLVERGHATTPTGS
jgi:sugar lactone lactonase YvrE